MLISIDKENAFDTIQHSSLIKNFQQTRNSRELPQMNKGIYKTTA